MLPPAAFKTRREVEKFRTWGRKTEVNARDMVTERKEEGTWSRPARGKDAKFRTGKPK